MKILCNKYETKEIIKFMRDCCEKTQTEFANETNITLKDFLELAKINNIDIIMKSNDTEKN